MDKETKIALIVPLVWALVMTIIWFLTNHKLP